MSLLTKILGLDKIKKKAMSFPGVSIGNAPTYFKWADDSSAYTTNDTVFTVIKKIGRKAASVPLFVYNQKSGSNIKRYKSIPVNNLQRLFVEKVKTLDEIQTDSPLAKLLSKPNPSQGADAFFEGTFSFYALRGEAFIWLNRGGLELGEVLEMYIIPPDLISIIPDPQDLYGLLGYLFLVGGTQVSIAKEDIIHWKTFNPNFDAYDRSHMRGFDPLQPLTKRIQQDTDSMDSATAMFQNGGSKGVLFNKDLANLTLEQETQLRTVIRTKINNVEMKAAVAALQGEWGYVNLGLNSVDMDLIKSQNVTLERIAMALGVDPDILITGQSFSNKEWAQKKFVTDLIMPMCNSLRDELNRVLVEPFKNNAYVDFDFSLVSELQDDLTKMVTVYNSLFDRGVINGSEFRMLTNFDPSGNPIHEQFLITGGYGLLEDVNTPQDQPIDPNAKYNDYLDDKKKEFVESEHPRVDAGSSEGGQFTSSQQSNSSCLETAKQSEDNMIKAIEALPDDNIEKLFGMAAINDINKDYKKDVNNLYTAFENEINKGNDYLHSLRSAFESIYTYSGSGISRYFNVSETKQIRISNHGEVYGADSKIHMLSLIISDTLQPDKSGKRVVEHSFLDRIDGQVNHYADNIHDVIKEFMSSKNDRSIEDLADIYFYDKKNKINSDISKLMENEINGSCK